MKLSHTYLHGTIDGSCSNKVKRHFGTQIFRYEMKFSSRTHATRCFCDVSFQFGKISTNPPSIQDMWLRDVFAEGSRTSVDVLVEGLAMSENGQVLGPQVTG